MYSSVYSLRVSHAVPCIAMVRSPVGSFPAACQ
jgi:hypothetical protein